MAVLFVRQLGLGMAVGLAVGWLAVQGFRHLRLPTAGLYPVASLLQDGRYAVTGPHAAVGGRRDLSEWARRRMRRAQADERAWLQTVVGALAAEVPE
jgi:hypothetical protein